MLHETLILKTPRNIVIGHLLAAGRLAQWPYEAALNTAVVSRYLLESCFPCVTRSRFSEDMGGIIYPLTPMPETEFIISSDMPCRQCIASSRATDK